MCCKHMRLNNSKLVKLWDQGVSNSSYMSLALPAVQVIYLRLLSPSAALRLSVVKYCMLYLNWLLLHHACWLSSPAGCKVEMAVATRFVLL